VDLTKEPANLSASKGLAILSHDLYGNVIRSLVPLTASDSIAYEGLGVAS
jgi:hypothetical protein